MVTRSPARRGRKQEKPHRTRCGFLCFGTITFIFGFRLSLPTLLAGIFFNTRAKNKPHPPSALLGGDTEHNYDHPSKPPLSLGRLDRPHPRYADPLLTYERVFPYKIRGPTLCSRVSFLIPAPARAYLEPALYIVGGEATSL